MKDLSLTGIHNGFAPVSRLYHAVSRLYRKSHAACLACLAGVSRCIAPVSRLYRACIAPVSRLYREYRACIRVSQCKIKFTSLTQIHGCLADSRVYRSVSRASRRLSRVYRGCIAAVSRCIAGLAEEDSHVSRLSHEYRGCFTRVSRSLAL